MTVGEKIKKARREAGLTQTELAKRLGIPYQSISQYERNTRTPKVETINAIAFALGINPFFLYDDDMQKLVSHIKSFYAVYTDPDNPDIAFEVANVPTKSDIEEWEKHFNEDYEWTDVDENKSKLLYSFNKLNDKGQEMAVDYVQLLAENEKYLKE